MSDKFIFIGIFIGLSCIVGLAWYKVQIKKKNDYLRKFYETEYRCNNEFRAYPSSKPQGLPLQPECGLSSFQHAEMQHFTFWNQINQ